MSSFDPTEYFARREAEVFGSPSSEGVSPFEKLEAASSRKAAALDEVIARRRREIEAFDQSLVGRVGFSERSAFAKDVNLAVGAVAGVQDGLENAVTAYDQYRTAAHSKYISAEQQEAFGRYTADEAAREELRKHTSRGENTPHERNRIAELQGREGAVTEEDVDVLMQRPDTFAHLPRNHPMRIAEESDRAQGRVAPSALERLEANAVSERRMEVLRSLPDIDKYFYSEDQTDLEESMGKVWDKEGSSLSEAWQGIKDGEVRENLLGLGASVASLLAGVGEEALGNLEGVKQFLVRELSEDLGVVAIPGVGQSALFAANSSRAVEAFNAGVQSYYEENGVMPPPEVRDYFANHAAIMFTANYAGDLGILKAVKFPVPGKAKSAAAALKGPGRVAGATTMESTSEGIETYAEGEARYDSATGREIFRGVALGGVAGGGAVSPAALDDVVESGRPAAERLIKHMKGTPKDTRSEQVKKAEASGDVSTLIDPAGSYYEPDQAMRILLGKVNDVEAPQEARDEARAQASEVMKGLAAAVKQAQNQATSRAPENIPTQESRLVKMKQDLAQEQDAEAKKALGTRIEGLETVIAQAKDENIQRLLTKNVARMEGLLTKATAIQQQLAQGEVRSRQAEAPAETVVEQITQSEDPAAAKAAVLEMVGRIQQSPESFTPEEVASALTASPEVMTPQQRRYLRSFSESQQRANALQTMPGVRSNIVKGDKEFAGIAQYRTRMSEQLGRDDKGQARKTISQLKAFMNRHTAKAEAVNAAYQEVKGTDKTIGLVYDAAEGWQRVPKMTEKARKANGGINVSNNTAAMAAAVSEEAKLLKSAHQELVLSYQMAAAPAPVIATTQQTTTAPTQAAPVVEPEPVIATTQQDMDGPLNVWSGSNENAELSNLAPRPFTDEAGRRYESVEHAYQSWKSGAFDAETYGKYKPGQSRKFVGKKGTKTANNWNVGLMDRLIEQSFRQNPKALAALLATGERLITHTQDRGIWKDAFPAALMRVRDTLRNEEAANEASPDPADVQPTETAVAEESDSDSTEPDRVRLTPTSQVDENGIEYDPETGEILSEPVTDGEQVGEQELDRWTQDEGIEPYGKLKPLTQALKQIAATMKVTGETFSRINLVQRFMDQRRKGRNGNPLPLVEVENFLTELDKDPKLAEQFLGREMTPAEENALAAFIQISQEWNGWLGDALPTLDEEKKHIYFRDPIKFLMDESGALEENVMTAISAAAFDFATTAAQKGSTNTESTINSLLGRESDHPVSPEESRLLSGVGDVRGDSVLRMGYQILDVLGFFPETDAGMQMRETLAGSLGMRAMALLIDTGVVEQTEISAAQMADATGDTSYVTSVSVDKRGNEVRTGPARFFIKATTEEGTPGRETLETIQEASKGSLTLIPALLGLQSGVRIPGFKPVGFKQNRAKNSNRGVPGPLGKILRAEGAKPHYLRKDALKVWKDMTLEQKMAMGGAVEPGTKAVHKANRESLDAKNKDIERQILNFDRFVEMVEQEPDGLDAPFYMSREVWKMQRVGLTDTLINPQASKIHRHLVSMGGWEINVEMDKEKSRTGFLMALAEAYGIKTDKRSVEQSIADVRALMETQVVQDAVEALQAREAGDTLTPAQQQAIVAATQDRKQKYYSLEGLIAQAKYQTAEDTGQPVFVVHLSREVDGKTNGPMLGQWQLGAAVDADALLDTAVMGGFFDARSGHTQVNEWATGPGNQDLYQRTARNIGKHMQRMVQEKPGRRFTFQAIEYFTGTLYDHGNDEVTGDGRDLVKNPVTILMFGASMRKIQDNVSEAVVYKIYDKIEELANDPKTSQADVRNLVKQINQLLDFKDKSSHLNPNTTLETLLEKEFTKTQLEQIGSTLGWSLNKSIKETMQSDFREFIERRNQLNKATKTAFLIYETAYRHERRKLLDELRESGDMPVGDKHGRDLFDLSAPQEAEVRARIKDLEPVIHSAFSMFEGNLENGIYLAKREKEFGPESVYNVQGSFPNGFGENKKGNPYKHMEVTGNKWTDVEPGVSAMILALHSLDSYIAASSYAEHMALNVHDALMTGLNDIEGAAQSLNKNTLKGLMHYSIPNQMAAALERTAKAFADRYSADDINMNADLAEDYWAMVDAVAGDKDMASAEELKKADQDPLGYLVDKVRTEARKADLTRLQGLRKLVSIDQYSLPGGNYILTDADYAEIDTLIEAAQKVTEAHNAALVKQLKDLSDVLGFDRVINPDGTSRQETLDENADGEIVVEQEQARPLPKTGETAWGKLGRSRFTHDPALVAYFEGNPEGTAGDLLRFLSQHVNKMPAGNTRTFYRKLVSGLYGAVDRKMPVRYLTAESGYDPSTDVPMSPGALASFVSQSRDDKVRVRGTDYQSSQVNLETLLHELTHAVTAQVLRTQSDQPAVAQIKKDLEALREAARKEVHSQEFDSELSEDEVFLFRYAVRNLDELIAVGMTNRDFQTKILNRIQVATGTRTNPLMSGMKALINSLVKLVFRGLNKDRGTQKLEENGMAVLIANVSMLAEQNRQRVREPNTNDDAETGLADALESQARASQDMGYLDLYDALATLEDAATPVHQARVRGLLTSLSQSIYGPFETFRDSLRSQEASSPIEVLIKSYMDNGQMPFASDVMASGFDLTDQQLLAAEQIELTVRESLSSEPAAYRELLKVWTEAKKMITVESLHDGDWTTATQDEKAAAQEKHDFLFKIQAGNDARVNHLSRFTGLALTQPELYDALDRGTHKDTRTLAEMSLMEAIGTIFQRLLDMFNGRMTHTYPGQNANDKLTILAKQLVDNEAKHRRVKSDQSLTLTDRIEARASEAGKNVFKKIEQAGRSNVVRNSRNAFVKAGGSLASTIAGDRLETLMTEMQKIHGRMTQGKQGMLAGLASEARGAHDSMTKRAVTMLREYAKTNEAERRKITETVSRVALEGFENRGEALTKKDRAALTRMLRADLGGLMETFTLAEIEVLVRDQRARNQAIKDYENRLKGLETSNLDYYRSSAQDLAYRMVTGNVVSKNLMHNAHNIAYLAGTKQFGKVTDAQADAAIAILDPLASLYALEYSPDGDRRRFSEMLRHEANREDGNGVEHVIKLYNTLQKQAAEALFDGNPVHMVKGYTAEIYDPYRTLVAEVDDVGQPYSKAERLIAMGYTRLGAMELDSTDPDQTPKALFVIRDGGAVRRVSGSLSMTDERTRGTTLHGGLSVESRDGINGANARVNAKQKRDREAAIDAMFHRDQNYDPRKVRSGRSEMAPIFNKSGEITGYHYLMKQETKDKALKRNNDFSSVLGAMAATNFDKPATKEQNRKVVKALHEEYQADFHKRPENYLRVSPDSADPKLREFYSLLPYDTQQAVREVWGERGMWIRADVLDITFGYQKWSLNEGLGISTNAEMHNQFQKIAAHFVETVYGPKAALHIRRGEDFVMALTREVKDFLVIKSGVVMMWNIVSNMSVLMLAGVSPIRQVALHREAIDSTLTYRRDSGELRRLKTLKSMEYVDDAGQDIEQRILVLEDALSRNKAHKLVEGGLMPTIVEDVDMHEDPFSYKSQFAEWADQKTEKVWSPLKTAGKWAYMTHDTPLYRVLGDTTQMSDFVARYVMYEHTTTRKRNPLSHTDALQHASEMFINYDIPTDRITQYLNDTGLLLFTKYYIRVQRTLMTLMRDNPVRFLMVALMNNMFPGFQTVIDSAALGRLGNPLDMGPLLYPEAVGGAMTINAGTSLFQ